MLDYNALAADYARYRQAHPAVLRELIATPNLNNKSTVLEVGCGTGNYIVRIHELTDCTGTGIDPSDQMLSKAQERNSSIRFHLAHAEATGEPVAMYDLVFSVDVIHHIANRTAYWREAMRVLRPGGLVCTVTDSEWIIRNRQPLSAYFPETVELELQRYPAIASLYEEMQVAGFASLREHMVEFEYDLTDASPYRTKAYSALHLISDEAHASGLEHMEHDLRDGPIACVSRYVLLWGAQVG